MDEEQLSNDDNRKIVRIGDTVHRPTNWWTPSVHHLLNYLEQIGFEYAPRVLGFDEHGREVLTFMDGESGKAGWQHITNDEGLASFARLLKMYHEAIADYRPEKNAKWAYGQNVLKPDEIMCHGDFGPWNITWINGKPAGIIDWDLVLPATPDYDVLYALQYATPFADDKATIDFYHFSSIPDRKHRILVFLEAYGIGIDNVVKEVAAVQRKDINHVQYLADKGVQPQHQWVKDGYLAELENKALWTDRNRSLFE